TSRPEIADKNADISGHDVIFLGFPIWWYIAPTIINTFLEAYDFSGKKIILFATSGGSGFGKAVDGLKSSAPGASIQEGRLFRSSVSVNDLKKWAESLNL
ncbi:MAG: flavodoxin, partial [Synergistaceae bacterium]|nr:flavodoxin [Synergistaceae bacterium]